MKLFFLMKRFLIFFLILLIAYLSALALGNSPHFKLQKEIIGFRPLKKQQDIIKKNVFKDGEVIKFGIFSYGVRVGSGQLNYLGVQEVEDERSQGVIFTASTFSVQDEDYVKGDLDFSSPIEVNRKISLFGKKEAICELYAHDRKGVVISKIVNDITLPEEHIYSDERLNNVLLLIYQLRNDEDIKEGKVYYINLPTQKFELIVDSRKKIRVPLGEFDVFYLESRPPKYKIWLQEQDGRIPVKIQGLVAGGMVYLAATELSFQGKSK